MRTIPVHVHGSCVRTGTRCGIFTTHRRIIVATTGGGSKYFYRFHGEMDRRPKHVGGEGVGRRTGQKAGQDNNRTLAGTTCGWLRGWLLLPSVVSARLPALGPRANATTRHRQGALSAAAATARRASAVTAIKSKSVKRTADEVRSSGEHGASPCHACTSRRRAQQAGPCAAAEYSLHQPLTARVQRRQRQGAATQPQ